MAAVVGVITFFTLPNGTVKSAVAFVVGIWLVLGTLSFVRNRFVTGKGRFTAEMVGMCFAHFGLAVFFFGVLMTESMSQERDVAARPGQTFELQGYSFRFDGVKDVQGPNYQAQRGTVVVSHGGETIATMQPEKRAYMSGGSIMTEADIRGGLHRDLYVALGEPLDSNGSWALRLYVKPFVRWIWLGALLMAIGGFTVVLDKRFRRTVADE